MANPLFLLEAASGFEPLNKGFADLCLTTWLRRQIFNIFHFRDVRFPLLSGMFLYIFFISLSTTKIMWDDNQSPGEPRKQMY